MTPAEARAVTIAAVPSAIVVAAYLLDAARLPFLPWPMLGLGVVVAAGVWRLVRPFPARFTVDDAIGGCAMAVMAFWLLWLARPTLLPLSTGPDLTHHLILIHYFEQHWRLVRDPALERFLGEMAQYTPGSQLLVALAGAWSGSDGLRALHPVMALCVALQAAFLWLIGVRLLPARAPRPLALIAIVLLLAAPAYFVGGFTFYGFVAQIVAGLFVTVMWWAAVAWDEAPDWRLCLVFTLVAAAAFLTWPVYVGAPALTMALVILMRGDVPILTRMRHLAIALVPFGIVAALYLTPRLGWLQMAGTGGLAQRPSVSAFSWPLVALSTIGLVLCTMRRRGRVTVVFTLAVLAEAAAFYAIAARAHATQPYMAHKMFYLLLWPLAALACAAIGEAWAVAAPIVCRHVAAGPDGQLGRGEWFVAWAAAATALGLVAWPLVASPRQLHPEPSAVSLPLYEAGRWARENVPPACVEYLVGDDETAYWLHLAVLGNPRMSARTGNFSTYEPKDAIVRWLTPGGLPYAIADLPALPRTVRDELDIVRQFDTAAVVKRRGATSCAGVS
jgi:hypothetical protein